MQVGCCAPATRADCCEYGRVRPSPPGSSMPCRVALRVITSLRRQNNHDCIEYIQLTFPNNKRLPPEIHNTTIWSCTPPKSAHATSLHLRYLRMIQEHHVSWNMLPNARRPLWRAMSNLDPHHPCDHWPCSALCESRFQPALLKRPRRIRLRRENARAPSSTTPEGRRTCCELRKH